MTNSTFCYSTKGRKYPHMTTLTREDILFQETVNDLRKTIKLVKQSLHEKINKFMMSLYNRIIKFDSKKVLSEVWYKIKPYIDNIHNIKKDIQTHLGYKASFWFNNKPIKLEKIIKAWEMSKQKIHFLKIENFLYS
jgi:hypothetical protein